ncbi:hypothetical protein LG198_03470 [Methylobacillus arboreus]|uniref:hypothetical protein n=1 Tax=Methylobacillus arboreus TaxID=755170 RepID=UPI001E4B81B6|nr:hypothetical protein [Methylobacillus arboreus]MCB5189791.1 hypothetical protein [Methylobacillus arboreus]
MVRPNGATLLLLSIARTRFFFSILVVIARDLGSHHGLVAVADAILVIVTVTLDYV